MSIEDDIEEIVFTESQIQSHVESIGKTISNHYDSDSNLLLIGVLRGCVPFISDIMRQIHLPVEIDFLAVGSYGKSPESSGVVRVLKDLNENIDNRDVLLVEDIVDTGLTLNYLLGYLRARDPESVGVCALLDKPARREVEVGIDFGGIEVPNDFLVGYGLDYAQKYRNLPYIASLKDRVINNS